MKIAVIGASGFVGSKIVDEALLNDYQVKGIFRTNPIKKRNNLELFQMTIFDEKKLEEVLSDVDCVISAYNPGYYHVAQTKRYVEAYDLIFDVCKRLNKRIIVVIGATSLIGSDGELVKDGFYPKPWINALEGTDFVYNKYKDDKSLNVTFVSPAAELIEGKRTTNYQYGNDHLLFDSNFESRISTEDLAHAIIKEVKSQKYLNTRFTIAYK